VLDELAGEYELAENLLEAIKKQLLGSDEE